MDLVQFIAKAFHRWRNPSSRWIDPEALGSQELGRLGESYAARFLKRNHYKVLYRNFRPKRGGEIDIVCRDRRTNMLVFVEVKTRRNELYGTPGMAIDAEKRRRLSKGALAWLRMLDDPEIPFRFDTVELTVENGRFRPELVKNAFEMSAPYRY